MAPLLVYATVFYYELFIMSKCPSFYLAMLLIALSYKCRSMGIFFYDSQFYRYPNLACEVICSDIDAILDKLVSEKVIMPMSFFTILKPVTFVFLLVPQRLD